ncbi:hypothetical protein GCM10010095_62160 [Streptomyces anthocyanicus]|uniref:peptidase inhibitor family I36 protein n=1 Tax=Streptomyces TaxID=1883 RepID=UPI001670D769|nr:MULTISPECIES: peptidase inhibitor family I36 protein [Streptomyces]GGL68916.1 hypothetical protein GCM10010095_62160 [Streptomyces anthocyanicus]
MKKTFISGAVAAVLVTAASVVAGGVPASANPQQCPSGYVCVWGDSNYEGRYLFAPGTELSNIGSYMNDLTTSVWNRTGSRICLYPDADWRGETLGIVLAGGSTPNLGNDANDKITSWRAC